MNPQISVLYARKDYEGLMSVLFEGTEGLRFFMRIYREDREFREWFINHEKELWQTYILRDPKEEMKLKRAFEAAGLGTFFEIKKAFYTVGFALVEDIAAVFDCTTETVEVCLKRDPDFYGGRVLRRREVALS